MKFNLISRKHSNSAVIAPPPDRINLGDFRGKIFRGSEKNDTCHPELVSGSNHHNDYAIADRTSFVRNDGKREWGEQNSFAKQTEMVFSPFTSHFSRKRTAFTLAEVLITLGIIGVVAALTMPVLINNIQDKDLESRYNKAKNMLANGYKLMTVKEDMASAHDLFYSVCDDLTCISKYHNSYFKILKDTQNGLSLDNLPKEYSIKGEEDKSNFKWSDVEYAFTTNDGFIYGLIPDNDNPTFSIVTDVNCKNKPNTVKRDLYKFRFDNRGMIADVSDELLGNGCSLQHPENCMTREECESLKEQQFEENGKCMYFYSRWRGECKVYTNCCGCE